MPRPSYIVAVYADLDQFSGPGRVGALRRQVGRSGDVFSFEYDRDWLKTAAAFSVDPDLALVPGPQYPAANRTNFGILLDSAPDRWGLVLMQRRENIRDRRAGRAARSLTDWGTMLGALQSQGSHAHSDCRELFRRVVFSILIHNTDDHLRNHGFILNPKGIALSPAFDINPAIDRNELTLAINDVESTCDVAIALEAHPAYGLTSVEAKNIISKTREVATCRRTEASRLRIPKAERELMVKAFSSKDKH